MFISTSKERIVSVLQDTNYMRQILLLFLGALVVISGYLLASEAWRCWRSWQQARMNEINKLKIIRVKSRVCERCKRKLSCMLKKCCMHM